MQFAWTGTNHRVGLQSESLINFYRFTNCEG